MSLVPTVNLREVHVIVAYGAHYEYDVDGVPVISNKQVRSEIDKGIQPEFVICHEQDYQYVKNWDCELIYVVKFMDSSELEGEPVSPFSSLCAAYDFMIGAIDKLGLVNSGIFVIANPNLINELTTSFVTSEYHAYQLNRSDRRGARFNEDRLAQFEQFKAVFATKTIPLKGGDFFNVTRYKPEFHNSNYLEVAPDFVEAASITPAKDIRGYFLIEDGCTTRLCLDKVVSWYPSRASRTFEITTIDGVVHTCRYTTKSERDEGLAKFEQAMSDFFNQE